MSRVAPFHPSERSRALRGLVGAGAALAVASIALAASPVLGQVGSGWEQFQGDAAHSGTAAGAPGPPYRLEWHTPIRLEGPLASEGVSAPIVADGSVIVVAPDEVLAFDLATGDPAWSAPRELGPPAQGAVGSVGGRDVVLYVEGWAGHGPSAGTTSPSPTATTDAGDEPTGPVDSHVVAIDLESREQVWEPIEPTAVSRSGITVDVDRAYVADVRGEVFAIDLASGTVAWTASVGLPVTAPPAVDGDIVVVAARGDGGSPGAAVVGLDAEDGAEAWRRRIDAVGVVVPSSPAIADGTAVVPASDGSVRAYDMGSGTERWSARLGATPTPFGSATAISTDGVFATDTTGVSGSVYRLDLASGETGWDFAVNEPLLRGAPIVVSGSVLVATDAGSLNAFDLETGERIWRHEARGGLRSPTPAGSLLVAVRDRPRAGLDAFAPGPGGRLVREASPTTPNYLWIVAAFLIAGVPTAAVALAGGRVLAARLGPAFPDEDTDGDPGDPPLDGTAADEEDT